DLHSELNEKIGDFIEVSSNSFDIRDRNKVKENISTLTSGIILLSQKILKKEWDRVSKTWFKRYYQKIKNTA
ncbi:MAG: hypothetical protein RBR74_01495, partial [Ignavibacteriaceae bacterium]|nr:hypothetical protein [Ignavibacteriaceae bacterium]